MQWFTTLDPQERIASVTCLGTGAHTDPEHPHDDTTLMLCQLQSGKLIKIRLDMLSNRPHLVNYYAVQGTQGVYEASRVEGESGRVWIGESRPMSLGNGVHCAISRSICLLDGANSPKWPAKPDTAEEIIISDAHLSILF